MSDPDRLNHVLDAIDGALGEDYSVSVDAMHWAPPEEEHKKPRANLGAAFQQAIAASQVYRPPTVGDPSWLAGMRIIESPAVPPGEVVIAVDHEFDDIMQGGAVMRRVVTSRTVEARVHSGMTAEERGDLVERMASYYQVPACVIEHRWGPEELIRGADVGPAGDRIVDTIQTVCGRCGQREIRIVGDFTYTVRRAPPDESTPSFTCPRCSRTSYNPNDVREGYCGGCQNWTRRT